MNFMINQAKVGSVSRTSEGPLAPVRPQHHSTTQPSATDFHKPICSPKGNNDVQSRREVSDREAAPCGSTSSRSHLVKGLGLHSPLVKVIPEQYKPDKRVDYA